MRVAPFDAVPADRLDDPVKVAPGAVASWLPVAVPAAVELAPVSVAPGAVASLPAEKKWAAKTAFPDTS